MEFKDDFVILNSEEQRQSGFTSPLNMQQLDLHEMRIKADKELDVLEEMKAADDDELTNAQRASIGSRYERALSQRSIVRGIAAELATRTAAENMLEGITEYLEEN